MAIFNYSQPFFKGYIKQENLQCAILFNFITFTKNQKVRIM